MLYTQFVYHSISDKIFTVGCQISKFVSRHGKESERVTTEKCVLGHEFQVRFYLVKELPEIEKYFKSQT